MKINITYLFIILTLTINLIFCDKTSIEIQDDINSKNDELELLKNEIDKFEKLINEKSKEEKINNDLIKKIDKKIELTEKLIKRLTDEENYISKQIFSTKKTIQDKEEELFILKNQLKNRLKYLYKYGRSNLLKQITYDSRSENDPVHEKRQKKGNTHSKCVFFLQRSSTNLYQSLIRFVLGTTTGVNFQPILYATSVALKKS